MLLKLEEPRKLVVNELPYQLSPVSRKDKVKESKQVKTERTPIANLIS